jgi:hypothetical protein
MPPDSGGFWTFCATVGLIAAKVRAKNPLKSLPSTAYRTAICEKFAIRAGVLVAE